MLTKQERKILHIVCRESLLKITVNSDSVKKRTTFQEQVNLCEHIKKLSYVEAVSFVFNKGELLDEFGVRDFESKFKKFLKYGLAGIAGGIIAAKYTAAAMSGPVGITVALVTMYMYRKATDPCWQACIKKFGRPTQRRICKYECQVKSAKIIISDIRAQIGRCNSTPNPGRCERSLNKQYIKWSKKLQKEIIMLGQFKQNAKEKEAERRAKGKDEEDFT